MKRKEKKTENLGFIWRLIGAFFILITIAILLEKLFWTPNTIPIGVA